MAAIVELHMKTISTEIIKPSSPTPSHLKSYTLSLVDQIHPPSHTIMLLFYPKTIDTPFGAVDISVLKSSLSETLSTYYLFAGRCIDDFTVSCNDQGISFTETRVDCVLSDFLMAPNKLDHLHKFTPPNEFKAEKPLPELVPLAFQVNVFSCGGVVIGSFTLHKLLLDGTSLVSFLKHWAAIATSVPVPVPPEPDFEAVRSVFPPRPSIGWRPFDGEHEEMVEKYKGMRVVAKSFVFKKQAINELRAMAACVEVPKPTRVEALSGFVWLHCMAAAYAVGTMPLGPDPSIMSLVVNMRARLDPPLTSNCMGNFVTTASGRGHAEMGLTDLVREIHGAVSNIGHIIDSYQGGQNADAYVADIAPFMWYEPGLYGISSWCHFGLDQVDFGFGKPKWASPTNGILSPLSRNFIYFTVDASGDGIEVWMYLEEKEMQILESNKQFLVFASPN